MPNSVSPSADALFELYLELRRYVQLSDEELEQAPLIWNILQSFDEELIDDFYDEILRHPAARRVLQGPDQVQRLKRTLRQWLAELFAGNYDKQFAARRWQVGYRHVQIGLPSIWVNAAMTRLRERSTEYIRQHCPHHPQLCMQLCSIVSRMMDLDLALIQDAYNIESSAQQISRERDFAEGVIQTAQAVVMVVDTQGNVIRGNTFLSRLLGWDLKDSVPTVRFEQLVAPHDILPLRQFLQRVAEGSKADPLETDLLPQESMPRRIRWLAQPYLPPTNPSLTADAEGQAAEPWILCVGQDITDLTEAQRQLVRQERLAAIGQTMTGLAHESRNAFQRSQAALETLLLELEDRPAAVELIERIQRAHDHLLHLYEEVLQFARPVRLELQTMNIESVLRQTWEHLTTVVAPKQLRLNLHADEAAVHITADPFAVEQVFRNLLENAVEASEIAASVDVRIEAAWIGSAPAARVTIRDYGRGIAPAHLVRIFEPFFTTRARGTGLGLPIARRLAEGHGGALTMESSDPGVLATVMLPRVAVPDPELQLPSEDTRRKES